MRPRDELEREFQSARLRAVIANRSLRVRLNCPAAGYYRTVEVLGTAADTRRIAACSAPTRFQPTPT